MTVRQHADLRARRSEETRVAVTDAAIGLALERRSTAVTVEEIAERAGISRRTFFNHFTCKQEAFVPPLPEFAPEVRAAFTSDTTSSWYDALRQLLRGYAPDFAAASHQWADGRELYQIDQMLTMVALRRYYVFTEYLAGVIAERARAIGADLDAQLAAALCVTVMQESLGCGPDARQNDPAKLADRFAEGMGALRQLLT